MQESEPSRGWEGELERWLAPFLSALGREGAWCTDRLVGAEGSWVA